MSTLYGCKHLFSYLLTVWVGERFQLEILLEIIPSCSLNFCICPCPFSFHFYLNPIQLIEFQLGLLIRSWLSSTAFWIGWESTSFGLRLSLTITFSIIAGSHIETLVGVWTPVAWVLGLGICCGTDGPYGILNLT